MMTRRNALALFASAPLFAGTRATGSAGPDHAPPRLRTVPLTGTGSVRTVDAAIPFAMVGLTWNGPAPDVAQVRVWRDGGWTGWRALQVHDAAGTAASDPLWTGPSRVVQVRALRGGAPADGVSVVLIDPGRQPSDLTPRSVTVDGLEVVGRAQWGADESLAAGCGLPDYAEPVRAITVHHTAGTNDYEPADSARIVRGIFYYHAKTRGWCDIGYNALVDRFGRIFVGRAGGLDRAVIGAHAAGFNRHTSGVAMMGNFTEATPPAAMRHGLLSFLDWKTQRCGLDPEGTVTLVSQGGGTSRYPAGAEVELPVIFGHRDTSHTACPGDRGYALLPTLRSVTRALLPAP